MRAGPSAVASQGFVRVGPSAAVSVGRESAALSVARPWPARGRLVSKRNRKAGEAYSERRQSVILVFISGRMTVLYLLAGITADA